jgi:predicted methyltransferase
MVFREETIQEFNSYCDTTIKENMTFAEVVDNIDSANNNYFYVSMCKDDVIEAINNIKEIADQLDLDKVYIKEIGVYITLHP